MKRIVSLISIATLAAVAFVSCNKEVEVEEQGQAYSYTFAVANGDAASADAATKSLLGSDANGMFLQWESTDLLNTWALYTGGEGAYSYNNKSTVDASTNPVTFTIVSYRALAVDDEVYAVYPYSSGRSGDTTPTTDLTIPATQSQDGTDFDASAMPMVAEPFGISAAVTAKGSNDETSKVHFYNLGSIVEFDIYSPTGAYSAENIESVSFTSTSNIAGTFSFDLTTVDASDLATSLSLAGKSYSVKSVKTNVTSLSVGTATGVANAKKVYMVLAPGSYTGTVVLKTDVASYEYTISSAKEFQRAKVKRLGLNLESGTCVRTDPHPVGEVFVPATSIAAGDKILITSGNSGAIYVMGYQKSNNRDAVSYDSDGSIISTSDMYPMVVAAGETESSYFTLYDSDEDGYLAATASGSNYLKTNAEISVDAEWEIDLDGTGQATTFKATGSSNRNVMQFNSSSSLFSCYSSASQSAVYVFKKSTETFISAANQDIAYTVTSVTIPYNVYNASGATTVAFKTNPSTCASNLAINEGTKQVTFDITVNDGATRTVEVNITNNGVTKTVTINQAAAPTQLVMSSITATPSQNQIVFSWTTVANAEGYQVSTNGGTTYGSTQAATTFTWDELSSFTDYTIKVKAIGDGVYYLDSDAGTLTAKTTLALPTSITWTKGTKTVSWTDTNTGAGTYGTDYKYQYTIDNGESFTDVAAPGTSVVLSITESKTIKIKAVYIDDTTFNSALSDGVSCTVGDAHYYTKVSSIESGKKYLIVAHGLSKVLVPSTGSGKKASADVTISDSKIESTPTVDGYAVTITSNGTSWDITFVLNETTYYLIYNSSTNLTTAETTTKKWNASTSVSYGDFGFRDSSTATRGLIFRAGSTNQFGGYATSNLDGSEYYDVDIYKYE